MNTSRVSLVTAASSRTWWPTRLPLPPTPFRSHRSLATRSATVSAATRLGWVQMTRHPAPTPASMASSRRYWGTWVVLPLPVSPHTTAASRDRKERRSSSLSEAMGRASRNSRMATHSGSPRRATASRRSRSLSSRNKGPLESLKPRALAVFESLEPAAASASASHESTAASTGSDASPPAAPSVAPAPPTRDKPASRLSTNSSRVGSPPPSPAPPARPSRVSRAAACASSAHRLHAALNSAGSSEGIGPAGAAPEDPAPEEAAPDGPGAPRAR